MASRNGPPYPACVRYVGSYLTQTGYGGPFGPRRASWRPWREELPSLPDTSRIWWPAPGRGTTRACVADVRGTFVSDLAGGRKTRRVCVKQHGRREGSGRLCQSRKGPSYAWRPFVSGSAAPRRLCQTRAQGDLPQTPVAFPLPRPFATSARGFPGERSVGQTPPEFVPPACAYTISTGKRFVSAVAITPATLDGWHSMHAAHVTFTH